MIVKLPAAEENDMRVWSVWDYIYNGVVMLLNR